MHLVEAKVLVCQRLLQRLTDSEFHESSKVMYPKYFKHLLSTVAHTIDCVCSKILNHGLNHGL